MQARNAAIPLLVLAFGIAIAGMGEWSARAAVQLPADLKASDPAPVLHQTGNPLWAVPIGELTAMRDRPIFSASRRPPLPPAAFVAAPPPPPSTTAAPLPERPPLVLLGTIIGGSVRIGIFHEESTTRTVRLTVGEGREGWILRSISRNDANFEANDRVATLGLRPSFQSAMKGDRTSELTEPISAVHHRKR